MCLPAGGLGVGLGDCLGGDMGNKTPRRAAGLLFSVECYERMCVSHVFIQQTRKLLHFNNTASFF